MNMNEMIYHILLIIL